MKISFHYDIEGFRLRETGKIKRVIRKMILDAGRKAGSAEVIFTSDEKLLEINREFLSHDYMTDIITFDYCKGKVINGEIYISTERIRFNARENRVTLWNEAARVIFHGFLHLCGYADGSQKEKETMTEREDMYLALAEAE
jgi:rRNA maturation RNase YbeY